MGGWYPVPRGPTQYTLSVTLPRNFTAVSEAESVLKWPIATTCPPICSILTIPWTDCTWQLPQIMWSKKISYNDIVIESYFFKEDAALADTYIEHAKHYLELYESFLTPYPYKRFAIVENILPTGYAMPTFTLLGREVVRLPFIVKTSLAHEILHQWFGNYVYIDTPRQLGRGADHLPGGLLSRGKTGIVARNYRKQILVDYGAYVNADNAMPVSSFQYRQQQGTGRHRLRQSRHVLSRPRENVLGMMPFSGPEGFFPQQPASGGSMA